MLRQHEGLHVVACCYLGLFSVTLLQPSHSVQEMDFFSDHFYVTVKRKMSPIGAGV